MGDVGDVYNALKAEDQAARQARAGEAPAQVEEMERLGHRVRQLSFAGPHLRIDDAIDYWPSTGRWKLIRVRGGGRGFDSLKAALGARKLPQRVSPSEDGRRYRGRRQQPGA